MLNTVPRPAGPTPDERDYKALTVRIPTELWDRINQLARSEDRSLNYIGARLLRQALDQPPKPKH